MLSIDIQKLQSLKAPINFWGGPCTGKTKMAHFITLMNGGVVVKTYHDFDMLFKFKKQHSKIDLLIIEECFDAITMAEIQKVKEAFFVKQIICISQYQLPDENFYSLYFGSEADKLKYEFNALNIQEEQL